MRFCSILGSTGFLVAGLWLLAAEPVFAQRIATGGDTGFQERVAAYAQAHDAFEAEAGPYWNSIIAMRRVRFAKFRNREAVALDDYVLTQPPLYSGPPRPADPNEPAPEHPARAPIPVVADFLKAAAEHYHFVPQRPKSDLEFKQAYAAAARASGLTRDQIVRIYSFETGGNGAYDVQSGLTHPGSKARPISTAVGYNQLLTTNTVSILAEHGDHLLSILRQWAGQLSGDQRRAMEHKADVLRRMVAYSRTAPRSWREQDRLAKTRGGLGIHALLLDRDVGPLLQVQKLLDSVQFARRKGVAGNLTAAELEMMNLTGDGNGFDLVVMPQSLRERVPTSNFFQRRGYERNPIARRTGVVAALYADMDSRMDRLTQQAGARELASAY